KACPRTDSNHDGLAGQARADHAAACENAFDGRVYHGTLRGAIMKSEVAELAREVAATTGTPLPELMEESSPTLRAEPLLADDESFDRVGLIGGKDVGKSAIVNALVGEPITESTAYGPGTDQVVAYVHESRADEVRELLAREAPKRHRIVTHAFERLKRQV